MSQQYRPGDIAYFDFTVSSSSGALTNADSLPTAQIVRNGAIDGGAAVTINAALATGIYSGTYTIPGTYAAGDDVRVLVKATVGGVAGGGIVDRYRLVGWSPGATIPADLQTIKGQAVTCSGGVTIPAATIASTTNITAAAGVTLASSQSFSTTGSVGSVAGSVASVTAAVTLPSIPVNWITASGIAASAMSGKGDWLTADGYAAPPTASAIATASAAAILVTPTNKLATGPAGGTQLDLTQAVPTNNTAQTIGDALNAARAQGFGKWTLAGTALNLYAADGTTVVRSFTLDNAAAPTQRS